MYYIIQENLKTYANADEAKEYHAHGYDIYDEDEDRKLTDEEVANLHMETHTFDFRRYIQNNG